MSAIYSLFISLHGKVPAFKKGKVEKTMTTTIIATTAVDQCTFNENDHNDIDGGDDDDDDGHDDNDGGDDDDDDGGGRSKLG